MADRERAREKEEGEREMEVEREEGSSSTQRPSLDSIWVEKYRPKELADVIAHEHIMSTLTGYVGVGGGCGCGCLLCGACMSVIIHCGHRLIQEHRLPHMLFYGPPGTLDVF